MDALNQPNYKKLYKEEITKKLNDEFKYKSSMQIPKLDKIVINMGVGKGISNKQNITDAENELALISGQKPYLNKAKNSLAAFKLREGMPMGYKVTLRGDNMYYFLEKLVRIAIPRTRDFRGLSPKSFDGQGNYNIGIKEIIIFPEIDFDKVKLMKGCDINLITTAKTNNEALFLLKEFGLPFKEGGVN